MHKYVRELYAGGIVCGGLSVNYWGLHKLCVHLYVNVDL